MKHESVQLGLGKGVGAFLLNGILCGEHKERLWQRIGACADSHPPFLHRFEQRGLCFWGRAVDLVGQHDVGKQRTLHEMEGSLTSLGVVLQHVGAGDVRGHQVGCELDPPKRQLQDLGNGAHQQRLGQPGNSLEQAMPTGEQRDQQLVNNLVLTDNRLADLFSHAGVGGRKLVDCLAAGRSFIVAVRQDDSLVGCHFGNFIGVGDVGWIGHGTRYGDQE